MSPEHTKYLYETYPNLYRLRNDPRMPISYGFECEDGWFDIIDRLSEQLEPADPCLPVRALQVKQKLGELRFDALDVADDKSPIIWEAEYQCRRTCEICGKQPASNTVVSGYWQTNCDRCLAKRRNRQ